MTTRTKRKPPMTDAEREDAARLIKGEYFDFLLSGPKPGEEGDPKTVGARHATGKGILAHLDQLWKQGGPGEDADGGAGDAEGGGPLRAARGEIASLAGEGEDADGDDAGDG